MIYHLKQRSGTIKPPPGTKLGTHSICHGLVGGWAFNELGGQKSYSLVNSADDVAYVNNTNNLWDVNSVTKNVGVSCLIDNEGFSNTAPSSILKPTNQVTAMARVVIIGAQGTFPHLFIMRYTNSSTSPFWAYGFIRDSTDGSKVIYKCSAGGSDNSISQTGVLANNVITTVALTYDQGTGAFIAYKNGFQLSTSTLSGAISYGASPQIYIGVSEANSRLNGFIDVVWVWNRVLTPAELLTLHFQPYLPFESSQQRVFILATNPGLAVQVTDSMSFSDSISTAYPSIVVTESDSMSLSDSIVILADCLEQLSDQLVLSDNISFIVQIVLSVTDSMSFSDATLLVLNLLEILADQLSLVDTLHYVAGKIHTSVGDTLLLSDNAVAILKDAAPIADSMTFSDACRIALAAMIQVGDQMIFDDSVTTQLNGAVSESLGDTLSFSDSISVMVDSPISLNSYLRRYLNDVKMP